MITESQFASGVDRNVSRVTHYESGCDGSGNGGCDCIGLVIGAIRLVGGKWPWTHGTNYAARNRMQGFRKISSAKELKLHELVYKGKQPGESGYALPDKYKTSGDLTDYYHVGVVTSLNPLKITHCTSVEGGIKVDTSLGKWGYAGWLDQVEKESKNDDGGGNKEVGQYKITGGNLMLRKGPGTKYQVLKIMPNGAILTATEEEADGWIRVDYEGTLGYCMAKYLEPCENYDDDSIGAAISTDFAELHSILDHLEELIKSVL